MKRRSLRVARMAWGPLKVKIDSRTQELWGKIDREHLNRALIILRQGKPPRKAETTPVKS